MADPFLYDPVKVIATVLISFIPAIAYAIIIRYSEKYEREPWGSIGQAFLWGGTLGIVMVILIRGYFRIYLEDNNPVLASDVDQLSLILLCIVTPLFAEIIKPIGLLFVRGDLMEAEDGLIYGATIGLGYTATENLLFGIFLAPLFGIEMFITVVFMRSMSVMFIQSSTTALTCYGVTRAMKVKHKTGRFLTFPLFLLAAIGIHSLFNYIVLIGFFDFGNILFSVSSSLLFSIIFAFILMFMIYFKIYRLDRSDVREAKEQEKKRLPGERPGDYEYPEQPPPMRARAQPPPRRVPGSAPYYDGPSAYPPRPPARRAQYPETRTNQFMHLYDAPARPHRPPYPPTPRPPMGRVRYPEPLEPAPPRGQTPRPPRPPPRPPRAAQPRIVSEQPVGQKRAKDSAKRKAKEEEEFEEEDTDEEATEDKKADVDWDM